MKPSTLPGRGSTAVRTPATIGEAVRVGATRKFRKLLLPRKQIRAGGRTLRFDQKYLAGVAQAARDGAFPYIPLQVHETHTKDARYTEGTVSNLVYLQDGPDGDGLYGDIEFADDDGVKILEKSQRKAGVSVSLVENLVRHEDGRDFRWPAACQHVLLTTDPHVRQTGGGGWHPIELDNGAVVEVIDLTNNEYEPITEEEPVTAPTETKGPDPSADPTNDGGEKVTLELTREEHASIKELLGDIATARAVVAGRGSGGDGTAPGEGSRPDGTDPGAVNLEREGGDEIELMRSEIEVERNARIELARELQAARAASELESLGQTGLAPSIIEAARPLLEVERGSGKIELSRGRALDPTQIVRNVLQAVIESARHGGPVVELDRESGAYVGDQTVQAQRKKLLDAWDADFPVD